MAEMNVRNRTLFHQDNLAVLRGINSESIDLIATDPPFNKGRDFHATPESLSAGASFSDRWSWEKDVHQSWVDQIKDDWRGVYEVIDASWHSYGQDMSAFLCWMSVRLIEMHRILKPTGSIYLHCDPTASHYLKLILDSIFGRKNFRNEIVWSYNSGPRGKQFGKRHDIILWYSKGLEWAFIKDAVRGPYSPNINIPKSKEKYYHPLGKVMGDVWTIPILPQNDKKERTGYPTQKPIKLYERIIAASSNEGDVVLDPFAGCATTLVAAEKLNRQWIGCDIWGGALDVVMQRMRQKGLMARPRNNDSEPLTKEEQNLLTEGEVTYLQIPPTRTDEGDVATPYLKRVFKRPKAAWEKLSHGEIRQYLSRAQENKDGCTVCAGCGRILEVEFMELDHIMPRSDGGVNDITNRVLICRPCNGKKSNSLTLSGLVKANKKSGWMRSEDLAKWAHSAARNRAEEVKIEIGN